MAATEVSLDITAVTSIAPFNQPTIMITGGPIYTAETHVGHTGSWDRSSE